MAGAARAAAGFARTPRPGPRLRIRLVLPLGATTGSGPGPRYRRFRAHAGAGRGRHPGPGNHLQPEPIWKTSNCPRGHSTWSTVHSPFTMSKTWTGWSGECTGSLVPGGSLVFSVEHPIFTAPAKPGWCRNADGRNTWPIDSYLDEGPRSTDWLAKGVIKQHRTVATYLNLLIRLGFAYRHVEEWGPTEEQIRSRPTWRTNASAPHSCWWQRDAEDPGAATTDLKRSSARDTATQRSPLSCRRCGRSPPTSAGRSCRA